MKLYHNNQAWQLPGKQDKKAERIEVPTGAPELCAWLNARRVPLAEIDAAASAEPVEGRFWEAGPPTMQPPRYDTRYDKDHGKVEFVPVTRSAAIASSYAGCPGCQRNWTQQVIIGINSASLEDLELIANAIKRRTSPDLEELELNEQIDERAGQ